MTEPTPAEVYTASDTAEVRCPKCQALLGMRVRRSGEWWLLTRGLLIQSLDFALCADCGEAVRFGRRVFGGDK